MKNHWIYYFSGYLKVKISGMRVEQFLNICMREGITLWNIKKNKDGFITCNMLLSDIHNVRRIIRRSDCKLEISGKTGLPFLKRQIFTNTGFLLGLLSFVLIVFVFSNVIWNIEVDSEDPKVEHDLRVMLEEIGVERGKFHFSLPDEKELQRVITTNMDEITWVGVELRGTTYHFTVVEKKEAKEEEYISPRNLVAKKNAVIHDLFVEQGQPVVDVNDFVKKDDILVSGIIGKEGNTDIVAAKGEVFGEVWYESSITIPLETKFLVYTGSQKDKHFIKIFNTAIPVWGFGNHNFEQFETEEKSTAFYFLNWKLPLHYEKRVHRENEEIARRYDEKEAIEMGVKMGRKEILDSLDDDAEVKGEKILQQKTENGKVKLTVQYQMIENIAKGQPIIQGD